MGDELARSRTACSCGKSAAQGIFLNSFIESSTHYTPSTSDTPSKIYSWTLAKPDRCFPGGSNELRHTLRRGEMILALTFSDKAAREMLERFSQDVFELLFEDVKPFLDVFEVLATRENDLS